MMTADMTDWLWFKEKKNNEYKRGIKIWIDD